MSIEILSFIAAIFELLGIFLLGNKVKYGFISNIIGGICWIFYSFISGNAYGLIVVCSVALLLNTKGFIKWKKF